MIKFCKLYLITNNTIIIFSSISSSDKPHDCKNYVVLLFFFIEKQENLYEWQNDRILIIEMKRLSQSCRILYNIPHNQFFDIFSFAKNLN